MPLLAAAAEVDPTLEYVCGLLVAGNVAQWGRAWWKDRESRRDLREMLPLMADVKTVTAEVKAALREIVDHMKAVSKSAGEP